MEGRVRNVQRGAQECRSHPLLSSAVVFHFSPPIFEAPPWRHRNTCSPNKHKDLIPQMKPNHRTTTGPSEGR
jgi:hypothetical protein